jgi:predicted nucleotidyltransferase
MQSEAGVLIDFPFPDDRIFRYQAMQDILHHLVNNPIEEFTQKELARITEADISTVSRSVSLLEQLGTITVSDSKPAKIALDDDHVTASDPRFNIRQQEFRKPVRTFLDELTDGISSTDAIEELVGVLLFGSVARGEADRSSDIDLLVVVDGDGTRARRLASKLARDLEDRAFDGDRYEFEVLVETVESAASHGEKLREIFDEGIVLDRTERLSEVRATVYADGEEAD